MEKRVSDQVEIERVSRLKRFLSPQVAELLISSGDDQILKSHRREASYALQAKAGKHRRAGR